MDDLDELRRQAEDLHGVPMDEHRDAWVFDSCADARAFGSRASALGIEAWVSLDCAGWIHGNK